MGEDPALENTRTLHRQGDLVCQARDGPAGDHPIGCHLAPGTFASELSGQGTVHVQESKEVSLVPCKRDVTERGVERLVRRLGLPLVFDHEPLGPPPYFLLDLDH